MKPFRASDLFSLSLMMPTMISSETSAPEARTGAALRPSSVPSAIASRSRSPVEMCGTPCVEASRLACVPFPLPGGPMKISFIRSSFFVLRSSFFVLRPVPPLEERRTENEQRSSPTPSNSTAFHEPVVVPHDELRFDLLNRVHGHADDDQQRRTAEIEVEAHALREPHRQEAIESRADAKR